MIEEMELCCGTTCNKNEIKLKIDLLERQLQAAIDYINLSVEDPDGTLEQLEAWIHLNKLVVLDYEEKKIKTIR